MLRAEIGFYVGCINLDEQLAKRGLETAFPTAKGPRERTLTAAGLYDVCLALMLDGSVVGNALDTDGKSLLVITGANQGGKSTLLRSIGLAQLMTQCGMFVGAREFRASVCSGVFTHYKREEDENMESGKLDEELARMSEIADHITAKAMLLCNESFSSTNEREGSQIAREVINAMVESDVGVLLVTHMFDLANGFYERRLDDALFLRAERGGDGGRSFRITEGRPLPTSYGEDSYRKVFGRDTSEPAAARTDAQRSASRV
jgi:DNA mismatch repair ATPase MutS